MTRIEAILLAVALAMGATTAVVDSLYYVDQRPTPRALFSLAGAYLQAGDLQQARAMWKRCAQYNEIYGTDYRTTPTGPGQYETPGGGYIHLCRVNLQKTRKKEAIDGAIGGRPYRR